MEGPNEIKTRQHYEANYWLDKELPIFIEFMETGSSFPNFAEYAGLKIFGNYSRINAKKSVAINFRKKYGCSQLNYTLFPEFSNLTFFKSFILRNNGENFKNDYIRDRLASSISEGLNVDYQRGRFVLVYYNNRYFGIHDMRERSNEHYFETHYNISPQNIDILKADNSVSAGSPTDYQKLFEWLKKNPLNNEKNYEYIATQIDINNFINYTLIEIYSNNRDWPGNNLKKWRTVNPKSQWKWFLYDLDWGFGSPNDQDGNNIFEFVTNDNGPNWPNGPRHTLLLRQLLENENFFAAFINRMVVLLHKNFDSSKVGKKIDHMMSEINDEIARDQKRWKLSSSRMDNQLAIIKKFAKDRPQTIYKELQDYFKLGELKPITISASGKGTVSIHDIELDSLPITIPFFKGIPINISAIPKADGAWNHWNDGDSKKTRTIYPETDLNLIAIFK